MGFSVLVVDDNEGAQRLLLAALSRLGVRNVLQVQSLDEARSLFAENFHGIDGMIVDGNLGRGHEKSGVTFVREVRQEGFTGPIVACSTDEETNREMMSCGADAMIFDLQKVKAPEILLDLL